MQEMEVKRIRKEWVAMMPKTRVGEPMQCCKYRGWTAPAFILNFGPYL